MIIRKAKIKEAQEIARMWNEFMKEHDSKVIKKNKKAIQHVAKLSNSQSIFAEYINTCIRSKNASVHVAEDDGKLVAYSLIKINKNIPVFKINTLGYFADLFVKKEYRGKGISSKFRDLAILWFKKKGIKYISITVHPENEYAHSIYKKWGFFDFHVEMRTRI